jgi:DNA mismatch repair protein MSH5
LGKDRPKVVAATHFHEMFENGFLGERPTLAFGHMEIHQDRRATEIEDQISYLYNFVPGKSTSSFGTYCAAMNGIDSAIIKRADQLMLLSFQGEDLVAACEVLSEQDARLLEEAEEMARSLLAEDLPIKPLSGSHVRGFLQTVVAS